MSTAKSIMGVVPGVMSLSLVAESMKMIPTKNGLKGKKEMKPMKMVKGFTKIMIGIPLIGATAGMINKLP